MSKIGFLSLGCPKNQIDGERMLALLQNAGHEIVDDLDGADAVLVNTCAFIEDAKKEMQQITDFSMRIPGQRRKNPLPTMPPNLAPSKTAEYFL